MTAQADRVRRHREIRAVIRGEGVASQDELVHERAAIQGRADDGLARNRVAELMIDVDDGAAALRFVQSVKYDNDEKNNEPSASELGVAMGKHRRSLQLRAARCQQVKLLMKIALCYCNRIRLRS